MAIKFTEVNGIKIRYQELKNKGKKKLVFLHYGGATLGVWNGVIEYFKEDYQIIAPDLRCHGFSTHDVDSCHIDDMADDVAKLMEYLNIKQAIVIGSSLGSMTAVSLAKRYPKKVEALVLDGCIYDTDGPDSKEQLLTEEAIEESRSKLKEQVLAREPSIYNSKEEFIERYKKQFTNYFKDAIWSEIFEKAFLDNLKEIEGGKVRTTQDPETIWKYIEPLYGLRLIDYFKELNIPILWLPDEKEKDNKIVKRNLVKYAEKLPYHKIVTIPGSVHAYTCVLKPKELANEILTFIDEIQNL